MEDALDEQIGSFILEVPTEVAVVSRDGHYKHWSRAFQKNVMLGMPSEDILKINLFADDYHVINFDGHTLHGKESLFTRAIRDEDGPYSVMLGLPTGQNSWNWTGATIAPRKDKNGKTLDYVFFFQLISSDRQAETNQTIHTFQDSLSGLPNRVFFSEMLSQALNNLAKEDGQVGVLYLDVNHFSNIIDSQDYETGDRMMAQIAKRLRSVVKHGNVLARLGGDEFGLLFDGQDVLKEAFFISDSIKIAFDKPLILDGQEYYIEFNQGLAVSSKPDIGPGELIRNAEVAVARAKTQGTKALEVHDQSMNDQMRRRLKLESDMRHALEKNEFTIYYHPLVNLATGKLGGWEALIRWQHPERGLIPPGEFIGLAEETGAIVQIGTWVLEESCRQAQEWRKKFPSHPKCIMNVNLSMRQFQQQNLPEMIRSTLEKTGLEPNLLKLEITENVAMKDAASSLSIMTALKGLGVSLAIDDFGTDYSSLSYLKRLPVDSLKIDKSFVDGICLDKESTAIVQAILSLAKALDISVTAEGIENADQLRLLRELGCHIGQGYYFSIPLPPPDAEKLLEQDPVW
ncbi:MAG: bifunctional diguanylate cyclase/phosphodiesterase, partial [Holophagales bacterium]|jgi:diguanylate cyclase (GGDEF)-like protein|nr:bifunctional diguanylate cyclase/phosphodiesterase [Holophagales bacterium]